MATKSSVGWVILAVALAVPGVLFYRWFSHLDKAQKRELSVKVRSRIPDGGPFAVSPNKNKLVNPMATPAPAAPATPGALGTPAAPGVLAAPDAARPMPAAAAAPAPTIAASVAPPAANPGIAAPPIPAPGAAPLLPGSAAPAAAVTAPPADNPFLAWRDPTISPYDQLRIEQQELSKLARQQELREATTKVTVKRPAPKLVNVEKLIELQGIVSTDSGNKAIVNGEMVGAGEVVQTQSGSVKILRITQQEVVFQSKTKQFRKMVNR